MQAVVLRPRAGRRSVATFYGELLARIERIAGVRSAAVINHPPFSGPSIIAFFRLEGNTQLDRRKDRAVPVGVRSPDYFRTLRIPLLAGRPFDERDGAQSAPVAIVNGALARWFYPDEDAIGKEISFGCREGLCRTIVGVVGDARRQGLALEPGPEIYIPHPQSAPRRMTLVVRTMGEPIEMAAAVRSQVQAVDRCQPVYRVQSLERHIADSIGQPRVMTALGLAALGVYGVVVSYGVAQRTREIGIRVAAGIAIGVAAAAPFDATDVGAPLRRARDRPGAACQVLALTALVATYVPERRAASRTDGDAALRVGRDDQLSNNRSAASNGLPETSDGSRPLCGM